MVHGLMLRGPRLPLTMFSARAASISSSAGRRLGGWRPETAHLSSDAPNECGIISIKQQLLMRILFPRKHGARVLVPGGVHDGTP